MVEVVVVEGKKVVERKEGGSFYTPEGAVSTSASDGRGD